MKKPLCSIRGLINDLARTLMGSMLHLDELLLRLDNDSEGFGEAWLANQQLERALEFFLEMRSEFMICHEFGSLNQCKMDYDELTTLDKILHKYNNIFGFILGHFELIENNSVNIPNFPHNRKRLLKIIQDAQNLGKTETHPLDNNYLNNKPINNYKDIKLVNSITHNKSNSKKILLVEDDEGLKKIFAKVLRQNNYSVTECSNGKTALSKFERSKSNFIICIIDIELPDIKGPDLVKKLMIMKSNINVLYITGYDERNLKRKFPLINQHQIMTKPFHLVDLVNKIKSITIH